MADSVEKVEGEATKTIKADLSGAVTLSSKVETAVEAWFSKHFQNNRISQDEVIYNMAHAAKEDLKKILSDL